MGLFLVFFLVSLLITISPSEAKRKPLGESTTIICQPAKVLWKYLHDPVEGLLKTLRGPSECYPISGRWHKGGPNEVGAIRRIVTKQGATLYEEITAYSDEEMFYSYKMVYIVPEYEENYYLTSRPVLTFPPDFFCTFKLLEVISDGREKTIIQWTCDWNGDNPSAVYLKYSHDRILCTIKANFACSHHADCVNSASFPSPGVSDCDCDCPISEDRFDHIKEGCFTGELTENNIQGVLTFSDDHNDIVD